MKSGTKVLIGTGLGLAAALGALAVIDSANQKAVSPSGPSTSFTLKPGTASIVVPQNSTITLNAPAGSPLQPVVNQAVSSNTLIIGTSTQSASGAAAAQLAVDTAQPGTATLTVNWLDQNGAGQTTTYNVTVQ
jgi:hypothetical protein